MPIRFLKHNVSTSRITAGQVTIKAPKLWNRLYSSFVYFLENQAHSPAGLSVTCGTKGSILSFGGGGEAVCTEAHHTPVSHVLLFIMDFPWSKITL